MRVLGWLAAIVVVVLAALAALPLLLPADTVRAHVISQIEAATGLSVRIDGEVGFSVWPLFDLLVEEVTVASGDDVELQASRVRVGLNLLPLMSGEARITELAAERPLVTLRTGGEASRPDQIAGDGGLPGSAAFAGFSIERLSITDGAVIVLPRDGGAPSRFEAIEAQISMPAIDRAARIEGQASLDGRMIALDGVIDSPALLLDGGQARVTTTLAAEGLVEGEVDVAADIVFTGDRLRLDDLSIAGADSRLAGWAEAVFIGTPYLEASLSGPRLDLGALSPAAGADEDPASAGPDQAPMDFAILETFAADIELALDELHVAGLRISPAHAGLSVDDSRVTARVARLGIAGGGIEGELLVDPTGELPVVSGRVAASGVDVAALAPLSPLPFGMAGQLEADLRFATAGEALAEFRHNANLAGDITLSNATATGLGLAETFGDPAADRLDDVSVTASITDINEPLRARGSAAWRGERFDLSVSAALAPLLAGASSDVDFELASQRVRAGYRGRLSVDGQADGKVSVETESLRALLAWLGHPVDVANGLEAFAFSGSLDLSATELSFAQAQLRLDETVGSGSGRIDFGSRPHIEAALALERLDVNPYLGGADHEGSGQPPSAEDWNDAPIDLAVLRVFDAELELSAGTLIYDRIEAADAQLAVLVSDGRLTAQLHRLGLYDGTGSGQVEVDASGVAPSVAARFDLAELDARPFLIAAADFRRIEGRGGIGLDLKASGGSQRELVSNLDGTASFNFRDGAVRGIDVARLARALSDGILAGWQIDEEDRTEFFELAASFDIAGGIARNDDLRLAGPLIDVTGAGMADMPGRSIDYRIEPRLLASGGEDGVGFGVPVVVSGPWAAPQIYPDIRGILQDPAAAYEQLRGLGRGIFGQRPPGGEPAEEASGEPGSMDRDNVVDEAARGLRQLLEQPRGESGRDEQGEPRPSAPNEELRGLIQRLVR